MILRRRRDTAWDLGRRVDPWRKGLLRTAESSSVPGEQTSDRIDASRGMASAYRDGARLPRGHLAPEWLDGESLGYQAGYRIGELTMVGLAAAVQASEDVNGLLPMIRNAPQHYLPSVLPLAAAVDSSAGQVLSGHKSGCAAVSAKLGVIPWSLEWGYVRWTILRLAPSAEIQGAVYSILVPPPIWFSVLTLRAPEVESLRVRVLEDRLAKGWPIADETEPR
jgi:hypothetical protein